jgi:hypothetical protein
MLKLRKDVLAVLSTDELAAVVAGQGETDNEQCVSGIIQCTTDQITERLTLQHC